MNDQFNGKPLREERFSVHAKGQWAWIDKLTHQVVIVNQHCSIIRVHLISGKNWWSHTHWKPIRYVSFQALYLQCPSFKQPFVLVPIYPLLEVTHRSLPTVSLEPPWPVTVTRKLSHETKSNKIVYCIIFKRGNNWNRKERVYICKLALEGSLSSNASFSVGQDKTYKR